MIIKFGSQTPLDDVLYRIEHADAAEMDAMIQAIRNRYGCLFPGWEVLFISIQTSPETQRRQDVALLIEALRRQYLE